MCVFAYMTGCHTKDDTYPGRWPDEIEISITLDPSLEELAPADEIYAFVADIFHRWLDITESNITINFEYRKCNWVAGNNCVAVIDTDESWLGHTDVMTNRDKEIYGARVLIASDVNWQYSKDDEGYSLERILMHEIGHFWGIQHVDSDTNDVMYPYLPYISKNETSFLTLSMKNITDMQNIYN